jgi:putative protein-disulfide isomerase
METEPLVPDGEPVLYYVGDPMCSWCWGFAPILEAVETAIAGRITLRQVMGGLAADSDEPMTNETRQYIREAWRAVTQVTGAEFNWDFWELCEPRRSTYPACRAVLAADRQGAGPAMFRAIQRAYYLQARNPSDAQALVSLSEEGGLDRERFARDLQSPETEGRLQMDFELRRKLGVREFPNLILESDGSRELIMRGYGDADSVLSALRPLL